ncbi:hypothetical protein [Sediminibacillus massiliensis]|nr:hypothetical protein [Sediminibacillus massiliensis]
MPVSKKEFEKLKNQHEQLEMMFFQLVEKVKKLEDEKKEPNYLG